MHVLMFLFCLWLVVGLAVVVWLAIRVAKEEGTSKGIGVFLSALRMLLYMV